MNIAEASTGAGPRPLTLAIATATPQVSVALAGPDGPLGSIFLRAGRRHGETLAPAIQALTRLAGVGLHEVGRVAVDAGPGLFTGLRVGVATAKALASALGVPLVASSSLDILAEPYRESGRTVVSVVDARRGEVFWAVYRPGGATAEPGVISPAGLRERLREESDGPLLVVGDGARRYLADSEWELGPPGTDHPSAEVLAGMAARGPELAPEKVAALYLRGADVRIGWESRPGARA
jgi:tRNA threonylcarbamoyladenosine biosynthesis protein TsaB